MFQAGTLQKKQADDFIIEFGNELAEIKEIFRTFNKSAHDLIANCTKNEDQTVTFSARNDVNASTINFDGQTYEWNITPHDRDGAGAKCISFPRH